MLHSLEGATTRTRTVVAVLLVALVAGMMAALTPPAQARAAELPASILEGGFIISDAEFFDGDTMTAAQIQTFLNGKVPACKASTGPTCLKNIKVNLPAKAADSYCKAVARRDNATAAQVIQAVAAACGVNPKVILVMLQKEQGLVTATAPSNWAYQHAMGMNCPDTAPCDSASAGFVNQVYLGARQQQVYAKNPTRYNYRAGQVNIIKWHPNSSCGTSKVFIQNQATANLYIYTPYRANVAALAAGYGTGDSCSAYGNRNFYNYYVAWFEPGASSSSGAPAQIPACTVPASADIVKLSGSATVTATSTTARTAPTLVCGTGSVSLTKGKTLTVTGSYGAWIRGTYSGKTVWVSASALSTNTSGSGASSDPCAAPAESSVTKASGYAKVTTGTLNARKAPTTACETGKVQVKEGQVFARTGIYGDWWRLTINGATYWSHSDYLDAATVTPTPTISGTAAAGQTITAATGTWSPTPTSISYQWYRGGTKVAGATSAAYGVTNDDAGAALKVRVVGTVAGKTVTKDSAAVTAKGYSSTRLQGETRFDTAVAVSKAAFPNGARTVYLVSGAEYADALTASPLAATKGAALLLANRTGIPAAVAAELKRLAPTTVVIVGGTVALDAGTEARVKAVVGSGVTTSRLSGVDRYDTARILAAQWGTSKSVFVATGRDFADALGAAAAAGARKAPVILVDGAAATLPEATLATIKKLGATSAIVVGGEQVMSTGVAGALTSAKVAVTRYGGADRYATNAKLNTALFATPTTTAVVASAADFPDALVGSLLASRRSAPIMVTSPTCAVAELADFLVAKKSTSITLIGGTTALWPEVARLRGC